MPTIVLMWVLLTVLAGAPTAKERATRHAADSVAAWTSGHSATDSIHAKLTRDAAAFFAVWKQAWMASERTRFRNIYDEQDTVPDSMPARDDGVTSIRKLLQHCHTVKDGLEADQAVFRRDYKAITSLNSAFAVCPTWRLGDPILPDEADSVDAGIAPAYRATVAAARLRFVAQLERAAVQLPADGMITAQRVRFLLDQQAAAQAMTVARNCHADRWWCTALVAYVFERRGQMASADTAFVNARALMTDSVRCQWEDVRPFIPVSAREAYADLKCADRHAVNERFWWLSDPLYSDPGNERRAVHDARRLEVLLRSAFPMDEHYEWNVMHGSDALIKMLVRYGWPSYVSWGGTRLDIMHSWYLAKSHISAAHEPYTTYEYSFGRVHTAPRWSAVEEPFLASDTAWQLNAPVHDPPSREVWWPVEHFRRTRRLLQLPAGQIAMLRRQNAIVLATAHELDVDAFADLSNACNAVLITSTAPDSFTFVDQTAAQYGKTLVLHGRIPSTPGIMAVEVRGSARDRLDVRTRLGLKPPPTLEEMRAGEFALSEPVLLRAPDDASELAAMGDDIADHMLGRARISLTSPRVAIYWESYGFHPEDSVAVTVRLERHAELSVLQRLGMAINVTGDPNAALEITWHEPDLAHTARTLAGPVPVQLRSLVLNLSQLAVGEYDLIVRVGKASAEPVSSRRRITIAE